MSGEVGGRSEVGVEVGYPFSAPHSFLPEWCFLTAALLPFPLSPLLLRPAILASETAPSPVSQGFYLLPPCAASFSPLPSVMTAVLPFPPSEVGLPAPHFQLSDFSFLIILSFV